MKVHLQTTEYGQLNMNKDEKRRMRTCSLPSFAFTQDYHGDDTALMFEQYHEDMWDRSHFKIGH
ncbi:hypothetical protein C812_01474 [Paenibacillus barengoltzii G22]|uniref:Uncharacterized protein n=1 Tax=Paenibacillus barengoltzii G22 TaxID=1235795 RepID=R9LED9_9BACL|nr:hypothetical protein C812_01474 [Paenibacillus barengoltzii G22]